MELTSCDRVSKIVRQYELWSRALKRSISRKLVDAPTTAAEITTANTMTNPHLQVQTKAMSIPAIVPTTLSIKLDTSFSFSTPHGIRSADDIFKTEVDENYDAAQMQPRRTKRISYKVNSRNPRPPGGVRAVGPASEMASTTGEFHLYSPALYSSAISYIILRIRRNCVWILSACESDLLQPDTRGRCSDPSQGSGWRVPASFLSSLFNAYGMSLLY